MTFVPQTLTYILCIGIKYINNFMSIFFLELQN